MPHAGPPGVLQELNKEERSLRIVAAEAEVLVEATELLAVQVDVKQLAGVERLRDPVREVETGHLLVCHFGIDAYHVGMLECRDEREHVARGGQEDVAARLVRLCLEGNPQVVALRADILAQEVDRLAVPGERREI